jgi:hypothetical protein
MLLRKDAAPVLATLREPVGSQPLDSVTTRAMSNSGCSDPVRSENLARKRCCDGLTQRQMKTLHAYSKYCSHNRGGGGAAFALNGHLGASGSHAMCFGGK